MSDHKRRLTPREAAFLKDLKAMEGIRGHVVESDLALAICGFHLTGNATNVLRDMRREGYIELDDSGYRVLRLPQSWEIDMRAAPAERHPRADSLQLLSAHYDRGERSFNLLHWGIDDPRSRVSSVRTTSATAAKPPPARPDDHGRSGGPPTPLSSRTAKAQARAREEKPDLYLLLAYLIAIEARNGVGKPLPVDAVNEALRLITNGDTAAARAARVWLAREEYWFAPKGTDHPNVRCLAKAAREREEVTGIRLPSSLDRLFPALAAVPDEPEVEPPEVEEDTDDGSELPDDVREELEDDFPSEEEPAEPAVEPEPAEPEPAPEPTPEPAAEVEPEPTPEPERPNVPDAPALTLVVQDEPVPGPDITGLSQNEIRDLQTLCDHAFFEEVFGGPLPSRVSMSVYQTNWPHYKNCGQVRTRHKDWGEIHGFYYGDPHYALRWSVTNEGRVNFTRRGFIPSISLATAEAWIREDGFKPKPADAYLTLVESS